MTLEISKHTQKIDTPFPLQPYNFCLTEFSIRRTIQKLFQVCELRESPCVISFRILHSTDN